MKTTHHKAKAGLLAILLLGLALLLCGCRVRTTGEEENPISPEASERLMAGLSGGPSCADAPPEEDPNPGEETDELSSQTRENPSASRKEYDENAPAEIVPGTDHLLHTEGQGAGAPLPEEESSRSVSQLNEAADETATRTVAAEDAENLGVSEDAEKADSALTYYTVLLEDRMGSLFECQRPELYWETALDHVTVHKSSPEHALILAAGCYDVSARLLPENLRVDDGWVLRKNPGVIVKMVGSGILGGTVGSASAASGVCHSLRGREGWSGIDAVKNGRLLLLSEELLASPPLQTAARLLIAMTAAPALFADTDPDQALQMLFQEAAGTLPTGLYYYCEEDSP